MSRRAWSWSAAVAVAVAAFLYGAVADGPPRTNADRAYELAQRFACPVCAGQSVAESDVSVAREIRRQIAVWVDEGRSDEEIRQRIVAAYGNETDYNPPASGLSSLVWILPLVAGGGIGVVLMVTLRDARQRAALDEGSMSNPVPATLASPATSVSSANPTASATLASPATPIPSATPALSVIPTPPATSVSSVNPTALKAPALRRRRRTVATATVLVVLFTAVAGVGVARFSGSRGVGESLTGEIRVTARELNFRALAAFNEGDIDAAVALYDEALQQQPTNAEALTYKGWLMSRQGGSAVAAAGYLDDAIASDPDYSDARLFRAILALESGEAERAAAELAIFDRLDPSPDAEALVEQARVRERVTQALGAAALERVEAVYSQPDRGSFSGSGLSVAETVAAAGAKASVGCEGCLLEGLQMLDWLLESQPAQVEALAARGWLLVRTAETELVQLGIGYLDEALSVKSDHPGALVYRAVALSSIGNLDAARSDLDKFDTLTAQPADLVSLIKQHSLRATLNDR